MKNVQWAESFHRRKGLPKQARQTQRYEAEDDESAIG
jgi:hypothetical protein